MHRWLSPQTLAIFRKDGRELLRDRRAIFVNLVLPMLLYPVLLLFALQVTQLTQLQPRDKPRVGVVSAPTGLHERLHQAAAGRLPRDVDAAVRSLDLAKPATAVAFEVVDLGTDSTQLGQWAQQLAASVTPSAKVAESLKVAAVTSLRARNLVQALILPDPNCPLPAPTTATSACKLLLLQDGANSDLMETDGLVDRAVQRWRRDVIEDRLRGHRIDVAVLNPLTAHTIGVATTAEAVRTHAAPMLPFIVLVLAVAAAMAPAIDLLAGERDRGTLETLLAMPVRRRDIVIGKLLVVIAAATVAVVLNLLSLGLTAALLANQLTALGGDSVMQGIFAVGLPALALALVMLLPVIALVSAAAVALSAYAQSAKEAQNYLTPLMLVVTFAGMVAVIPSARPSLALDLIPVSGTLLALREALQSAQVPWLHLAVATVANAVAALVLVGWCSKMFDKEHFRYPRLVRAGWGRWAKWRRGQASPDGPEALLVFAVVVLLMTLGGGFLLDAPAWLQATLPMLLFIAAPALGHAWLGAYSLSRDFGLRLPTLRWLVVALALVPLAVAVSLSLGWLQQQVVDVQSLRQAGEAVDKIVGALDATGGLPLQLLCLAVLPGICEELLCRGTLLTGIGRSLGRGWAVLLSALLFALLHQSPLRLVPQAVLGVGLALLTLRSGSLVPPMVVHAGHNALLIVAQTQSWIPDE